MGELRGFVVHQRVGFAKRDPAQRTRDYDRYFDVQAEEELRRQGGRCMDCGVPFCHNACPLGNLIPDWDDLVYRGRWREALDALHATNNFPEFTGLICPAPCESACVLSINPHLAGEGGGPVSIEQIELAIVMRGWEEGWIEPRPPQERTGRSVAVIGSGPAGMAVADELNKRGHLVTVYERDETPGGLCRFGVPDSKLEKSVIDRRVGLLEAEGVRFECGVDVGRDVDADGLRSQHDAVVIAIGSRVPRDVDVPGRELDGVHFAMDYLYQRNRAVARMQGHAAPDPEVEISAAGKRLVVIGGGDTGMDCISNSHREGAADATLLDVYQEPDAERLGWNGQTQWPLPPRRTPDTYALEEGGERRWATEVTHFSGTDGRLTAVHARQVQGTSSRDLRPVPGTEFELAADLALIAIGFMHPEHKGAVEQLGVALDARGNVRAGAFHTSQDGVFAAGDARIGQSLVVTAIAEGRMCARVVDGWLRQRQVARPTMPAGGGLLVG